MLNRFARLAVITAASAGVLLSAVSYTNADDNRRAPRNLLFTISNDTASGNNELLVFRRNNRDGSLREIRRSPFKLNGTGNLNPAITVGPNDSDDNIDLSADGSRLFTVNSGTNTIAVMDINRRGVARHVEGSPFPSGGISPVSVAFDDAQNRLYVSHNSQDRSQVVDSTTSGEPSYVSFDVNPVTGGLTLTDKLVVGTDLPEGDTFASPTQSLISRDGRFMFGLDIFGAPDSNASSTTGRRSILRSFDIQNHKFEQVQALSSPGGLGELLLGLQVHPLADVLYVGFVGNDSLGVYDISNDGLLSFQGIARNRNLEGNSIITGQPVQIDANGFSVGNNSGNCWFVVTQDGRFLYTSNNGDTTISSFDVSDPLNPQFIQTLPVRERGVSPGPVRIFNQFSSVPFQIQLSPDDRFVYLSTQRGVPYMDANTGEQITEADVQAGNFGVPNDVITEGNFVHTFRILEDGSLVEEVAPTPLSPGNLTARHQGLRTL